MAAYQHSSTATGSLHGTNRQQLSSLSFSSRSLVYPLWTQHLYSVHLENPEAVVRWAGCLAADTWRFTRSLDCVTFLVALTSLNRLRGLREYESTLWFKAPHGSK
jgi:hypothetical protein